MPLQSQPHLELDLSIIYNHLGKVGVCSNEFNKWLDRLQNSYGKKNAIRALPALQRGIDGVYSLLEEMKYRHHKGSSSAYEYGVSAITEDPTWQCLVSSVVRHFPKQVKVVRPSRTPHEAIRDKCVNRTFFNFIFQKQRLAEMMKPNIIVQGELGRLQVQILDAQISSLAKAYNERSQFSEQVWTILNDYKCRQSVFQATASPKATAEAKSNSLSADANLELFAGLKVEVIKEWDFANIMRNKITTNALIGSDFKAKVSASAKINDVSYASASAKIDEVKKTTNKSGFSDAMQLIPGIDLGVNAELAAMVGAKITVKHELTVGQIMAMTNEAELFVGAEVKASASATLNSNNIYGKDEIIVGKLGASAFAGLKATGSSNVTFKARGINAASVKVSGTVSAGIGITAEIEASVRTSGDIKFKIASGATAGIGASTELGATVNPVALKVILWDGFAHHLTTKKYQMRKNEKLDRNLNTVAIIRCSEHALMSLNSLEEDYRKMAEELWRIPVDVNFSNGTYHDDLSRGVELDGAYMRSVEMNSDHGMEKAEEGIMRSSQVLSQSVAVNKSHLNKQSRGRKAIRRTKGLLAIQPPVGARV
ncbi:hypothetical protein [Moritella sp. 28]|uniref:hypothetical protein n=1 Tax=Moritella sp. 28 TaxID=2746232 RepID=UPI001BA73151|nr:hypothetical protein [Moritella sp. 28]QUM83410.1 hypothetical protein HWV02_02105 [Moritella sp. 28]